MIYFKCKPFDYKHKDYNFTLWACNDMLFDYAGFVSCDTCASKRLCLANLAPF